MKANTRLSRAIAAILSAHAAQAVYAAETESETAASGALQEVIVTAERRSESIQNVPITVQAFTPEVLSQLHVTTFDDAVKYMPNVTTSSLGPGQSNVYMRGLATPGGAIQGSGVVGPFPNVAVYSIAQQLIVSSWDVVFAVVMVSWVFGWSGGKELVETSYGEAKERTRELKEERARKRAS